MGVRQAASWWWNGWVGYASAVVEVRKPGVLARDVVAWRADESQKAVGVLIAFALIYLIWGSTYYAIGQTVATVPPIFMVIVRGLLAGGVLLLWSRLRGGEPLRGRELIQAAPIAALLFGGGYVLVGWAEQRIPTGMAALLNASSPAFVVLVEWAKGLRGRPTRGIVLGLSSGVVGVALLVVQSQMTTGEVDLLAAGALVLASAAWALGSVLAGRRRSGEPARAAAIQLITGALILLPVSAVGGEFGPVLSGALTSESLVALGYLVVFGSLVGFTAYVWLLQRVPAAKVASHSYVNPLIAVIVGAVLGGEPLNAGTIVAAGLIVFSVVQIVRSKQSRAETRAPARAPTGFRRWIPGLTWKPGGTELKAMGGRERAA
jgi:drug/metabolite transporter (DMT)-like permease